MNGWTHGVFKFVATLPLSRWHRRRIVLLSITTRTGDSALESIVGVVQTYQAKDPPHGYFVVDKTAWAVH